MSQQLSNKMTKMIRRWKVIGEIQKEGFNPGNPNFYSLVSEKCTKIKRTDNPNDLKSLNEILDEIQKK